MWKLIHKDERADATIIGAVIGTLIAIIIGVLVWYKLANPIVQSINTGMPVVRPGLNATILAVNTTANTIWTLFPIVAVVMIAGIILAIVMGFGRSQA